MSETYVTYRVWDGCKAPVNLEYSGYLIGQIARESTIDRDALLALANGIEYRAKLDIKKRGPHYGADEWLATAAHIREALGVNNG